MSALSQGTAQNVVDGILGTAAFAATVTPVRIKLIATNGTQAAAGTEITPGGSYVSPGFNVTFTAATAQTGTYSAQGSNNAASQANMPATTVNGIELVDSTATPVRKAWGALTTARTTSAGDTLSFPAASLTLSI